MLFVDVDKGQISGDSEVMEAAWLPSPHREQLTATLTAIMRTPSNGKENNQAIADALLQFMVRLLGTYRRFARPGVNGAAASAHDGDPGIHPDFDETGFLNDGPPSTQPFLSEMRHTQVGALPDLT